MCVCPSGAVLHNWKIINGHIGPYLEMKNGHLGPYLDIISADIWSILRVNSHICAACILSQFSDLR